MYSVTLLTLLCLFLRVKSDILCETGFCRNYEFETGCTPTSQHCTISNSTHNGVSLPSPTVCNCCPYCLPFYGEGEPCSTGGPGTGTTVGRCGAGLTCENQNDGHAKCVRMQTTCHLAQDDFDERNANGETGALEQRPVCDDKGLYGPFHCVPTQTCFCQSEEGERIFGEVLNLGVGTMQSMHCGCSRFHEKIKNLITSGVRYPVIGPRCTSDGNFNPIQCINRDCYCVNRITGIVVGDQKINLDDEPLSELSCYDPSLDLFPPTSGPPYNYTTPCFNTMEERIQLIEESEQLGYDVGYFSTVPECLPDGTYGRVGRTLNGTKICVDEYGNQIEDYEALPYTSEYNDMDCKCAQTNLILDEYPEHPVCCKNGNFRPIQCRRGKCHCVDQDGRQITKEDGDVTKLSCYTETWKTC